jgi:uncharacterized membrane protein HdeD (DUF308 family)
MTTSHTTPTPTPPPPRPSDEQNEQNQTPSGGRDSGNFYGTIANSGLFGMRPWQALFGAGAVTFLLGLIMLIWPGVTLLVLALLIGCYLILSGILALIQGLSEHREGDGSMKIAYVVLGVLGIVLGLFLIRRIDLTVVLLAFLLSAFWIMRGVLDLAAATSRRDVPARGLRAFTGVLCLLAGVLVLFWPGITLTVLLAFAGAWLLIYGLMLAVLGLGLRRALTRG